MDSLLWRMSESCMLCRMMQTWQTGRRLLAFQRPCMRLWTLCLSCSLAASSGVR